MKVLQDKVIFLTGGSRGIGFECARKYRQAGAVVVIAANDHVAVEQAAALLGDVARPLEVEGAILQTLDLYGKIDVIHNNAGVADPSKPVHETDDYQWNRLFDINLKIILYTTRYGLGALKQSAGCSRLPPAGE